MDILIIGTEDQINESRQKFGKDHHVTGNASEKGIEGVIFDFSPPNEIAEHRKTYGFERATLFIDTSTLRLKDILKVSPGIKLPVFGFCGLKTFVNREVLEVTMADESERTRLESICRELKTDFRIVRDQAGMISARVIAMIINEAYYTLEEGTATREDIDLAMKLGTNYPFGPFEWGDRIGLGNVVAVLNAAEMETGDSRYAVCTLLKNATEPNRVFPRKN